MIRTSAVLCLLGAAALAEGAPLTLPEGARLVDEVARDEGRLSLLLGPWAAQDTTREVLSGPTLRQVWEVPPTDTAEIAAGIDSAARAAGYEVLYACATRACGGYDFRMGLDVAPPPAMFVDLADYRYLALRRGEDSLFVLVSRSGRRGFVQISQIGQVGGPAPAAPASTGVEADLDSRGRAILAGLRFASGSADLVTGRVEALADLAAYMTRHPDRRIGLVGHTDASGSLEANIALSRRRAGAVRDALVADYGVDRGRLDAEGMGYLAPIATNLTAEGRESNRRVEAILLGSE